MRKFSSGFTIVELVITMAVVGLMVTSLTNLVITTTSLQRQTDRLSLATRIAESKIESLRNNHYNTIPISPPALDFTNELPAELFEPRNATVTVSEPTPGMKRLDVTVTYRDGTRDRSVQLSALIGNIGISQ